MSSSICSRKVRLSASSASRGSGAILGRSMRGRASRDQHRIERIVLGPSQMHPAKRLDLDRLQHQHGEARRAQMLHHAAFVAARRLDADARHAGLGQVGRKSAPARQSVVDLPAFGPTVNRDVEFGFGRIDSSRRCVSLCHLPRPCLVKRTKLFRQPSGSDEGADAITLRGSHKLLRVGSIRSPAACRGLPSAAGHSFRNTLTIIDCAITRVGKGALAPCPPFNTLLEMVGTLPPPLVELRRTSRFAHPTAPWQISEPIFKQREDVRSRSRGAMHPRFADVSPSKIRGRRESRVPDAPAVVRTGSTRVDHRFNRIDPAFPARWCYGFLRALLGDRLCLPPSTCGMMMPHNPVGWIHLRKA